MNKLKKALVVFLTATLVFTSMGIGAFAQTEDNTEPADNEVINEQTEAPVVEDEAQPVEQSDKLDAVTNIKTVRGYKTVKLTWDAVEGATGYKVYVARTTKGEEMPETAIDYDTDETDTLCVIKSLSANVYYNVWVVPYVDAADESTYGTPAQIVTQKAHTLYYKATMKETRTVYCHCGGHKKVKHTFKKGYVIEANGYTSGKYKFKYDGHDYQMSSLRCKSAKSAEDCEDGYTVEEAEYFVNEVVDGSSKPSKTSYIVWASLYSQHVFVLKKTGNEYKVVDDFVCGSGRAPTPSPTGMSKDIWKKMKSNKGRKYWSCFSSLNSFHGLKGKEYLDGKTKSHGCIRLNAPDCKYVYESVPMKTRVIVF